MKKSNKPAKLIIGVSRFPWVRCQYGHYLNFYPWKCWPHNVRCDLWSGEDYCTRERGHEGIHG